MHLDIEQWNNLDAKYRICSEYNQYATHIRRREKLAQSFVKLIKTTFFAFLSKKQQQITLLYFESKLTEKDIAQLLGISQPTVSQHIFGKRRKGKKIGGAIRKIRKVIVKKTPCLDQSTSKFKLITVFQKLQDT